MKENKYTWEQVKAYSIIALHNLLNSANTINLKDLTIFIDALPSIHSKDDVVNYSQMLLEKEVGASSTNKK